MYSVLGAYYDLCVDDPSNYWGPVFQGLSLPDLKCDAGQEAWWEIMSYTDFGKGPPEMRMFRGTWFDP